MAAFLSVETNSNSNNNSSSSSSNNNRSNGTLHNNSREEWSADRRWPQTRPCLSLWMLGFCGIITLGTVEGSCKFPESFRGHWYQNGLGDVIIRENIFETKGRCLERKNDIFFMENTEKNCKQCLLIIQRHHNVIQYKESYCMNYKTLDEAKKAIKVEDNFFTLVREGNPHIPCPFQNNYQFTYTNTSTERCEHPPSSMKTCASPSKLHFRFRACEAVPNTYDRNLEFYCLAHWKDGYEQYVYGRFSGTGMVQRDDMYRCFVYEERGTELDISMSAAASCLGVANYRDGPLTLQLRQDKELAVETPCRFPEWINSKEWRDLADTFSYITDTENTMMRMRRRHAYSSDEAHTNMAFQCAESHQVSPDSFVFTSLVYKGCSSHFQCVKFRRLQDNVLDFYLGTSTKESTEKPLSCDVNLDKANSTAGSYTRHVLLADTPERMACPVQGRYSLQSPDHVKDCISQVDIGCNGSSSISISSYNCASNSPVGLRCLHYWQGDGDKTYILVGRHQDSTMPATCLVLEGGNAQPQFSLKTDPGCNTGAIDVLGHPISYTLTSEQGSCGLDGDSSGTGRIYNFLYAHAGVNHLLWWGLVAMVTVLLR